VNPTLTRTRRSLNLQYVEFNYDSWGSIAIPTPFLPISFGKTYNVSDFVKKRNHSPENSSKEEPVKSVSPPMKRATRGKVSSASRSLSGNPVKIRKRKKKVQVLDTIKSSIDEIGESELERIC